MADWGIIVCKARCLCKSRFLFFLPPLLPSQKHHVSIGTYAEILFVFTFIYPHYVVLNFVFVNIGLFNLCFKVFTAQQAEEQKHLRIHKSEVVYQTQTVTRTVGRQRKDTFVIGKMVGVIMIAVEYQRLVTFAENGVGKYFYKIFPINVYD